MNSIRTLYRALLPYETRFWLYKQRHWRQFRELRRRVNPSPKGNFSLRQYDTHRCIFVHITKTAGTSVATAMFNELPYHYTAVQYRVIFGRRDFNRYFKFAFVRNPWDRLYSAWNYLKQGGWDDKDVVWAEQHLGHIDDFNTFVCDWLDEQRLFSQVHFWPQCCFIEDRKGRCLIDDMGYFETIREDFTRITGKMGINADLPHKNPSRREDYRDSYTDESKQRIAQLYHRDIQILGYSFDAFTRQSPWES